MTTSGIRTSSSLAFARYLDEAAEGFFRFMLGRRAGHIIATAFAQPDHDLSYQNVTLLFETNFVDSLAVSYDVAPDGRFLIIKPSHEESDATRLNLVLNWFEELKRLVPTDP